MPAGAPFGYVNVKDREKPIQPHPTESKTVIRIFELYARGDTTFRLLADQLLGEGHIYRSGQPRFTPTALSYILNNRFYIGQFRWQKKQWRPGRHDALIDMATFQRCQDLLAGKNRRLAKPDLPLAYGLFRCQYCGSLITGERIKRNLRGGGIREHLYYRCANNQPGPDHPVVRWRAEDLDRAIVDDLSLMRLPTPEMANWFRTAIRAILDNEMESRNRQQTLLTKRRTELASAKDRLVKAYLAGTLDEGTLKAHSADLEVQLREAERGLDRCGDIGQACGDKALALFNWTQEAANLWQGSKIPQRRAILEAVSLNRQLSDTSLCVTKRKPFRELAERLPVGITRGERI